MNGVNKMQILISVLETIENLSNKDYQKRVWIRGEGPECDDFDETCNNFFGDGTPLIENYKAFVINEAQHQLLQKLHEDFQDFSKKNHWPEKFIDTPEWENITNQAKKVLKAFDYFENQPS